MKSVNYDESIPQIGYFICRHCEPNWIIHDSIIDFIDLTYVFKGNATYTINGTDYKAEKGDLICIPKYSLRHAEIDPERPMSGYAANFQLYSIKGEELTLPFPIISKIGIREDLLALYHELNTEWMKKHPGYAMKVRAIFLNILYKYFCILYYKDSFDVIDPRISKAIQYIYDNYSSHIEVQKLAQLVELNTSYFGTLFKKSTGTTVKDFINRVKINHAENLLASGEFSVMQVALRCGFEDMFYFSNVFKSLKGFSPSKVTLHPI